MTQSALTVTPPNPTPPTNFGSTGVTGPNPPNFTRQTYNDPKNWGATNPKDFPPPYYDDGVGASGLVFAANVAALASGTSAADNAGGTLGPGAGGTGVNNAAGTYPGASSGLVPASSSVAHEGAGNETSAVWGVQWPTGGANILNPAGPLTVVGCGPALAAAPAMPQPNQNHASSLSPATNPTLTTIAPTTSVHGTAAITMTATGVGFNRQSKIVIGGVPQNTTFVSSTSLTCLATPPATAVGNVPVTVVTGGVVTTLPQNWNIT